MDTKSTYFLYGYFGTGNFGDDILLYSAVKNILTVDPDASFFIRNYGPIDFEKDFPGRVQCTDIEKIHYTKWPSFIKFLVLLYSYWVYMGRVSTLVVGGGTLIHDSPDIKTTFLLFCLCLIAKIRGCRIFGIGLGTQKMHTLRGKIMTRMMIGLFNRICLRDRQSYDRVKFLCGDNPHIALTTDLAYGLPTDGKWLHKDKIIAVTLADYLLKRLDPPSYVQAIETLANVLTAYIEKGYRIRLLPLQKEKSDFGVIGDLPFLEHLQDKIPQHHRQKTEMLMIEANPESIAAAYDGVSIMIGMRFHALIFSAIKHIPFIGLAEEPKISAICDEFSLPCFAANNWNEDILSQAIGKSLSKTIDVLLIEDYRKLAQDNYGFITL